MLLLFASVERDISKEHFRMAGDSNFVLRWEIDNAAARLATGRIESGVFEEGGFRWTAVVERRARSSHDLADISLRCGVDHNGSWSCEAKVDVKIGVPSVSVIQKVDLSVSDMNCDCKCDYSGLWWETLVNPSFCHSDKTTLEFHINIISSERGEPIADPAKFAAPNDMSNVILKIGDEKLHVCKELLSIHSPFFKTMFFGDYVEKGKEEVEIKDIVFEEFVDLLHLIYLETMRITDHMVPYILKLADQFQMKRLLIQSTNHLMQSKGFDTMAKLLLADQYRLSELRNHCLKSFTSFTELTSAEYGNFTDEMKVAICNRIMELKP